MIDLSRPAPEVAPKLLGAVLSLGPVAVRLSEVEAYEGTTDPASHAWRGPTPRTQVMFGPPGIAYVYFSYGMHWAMNIVCCAEGTAGAVLLRAGEVVRGVEVARERRGEMPDVRLARGPGCLTQALGVTKAQLGVTIRIVDQDERNDTAPAGDGLNLALATTPQEFVRGPRVGVSRNTDAALRYWIAGDQTVSAYRATKTRAKQR